MSHNTAGGLPVGADEVLPLGEVHAGLAADRGVDHPEQSGGDVHDREPAVVHGGCKPTDVGDEASAHGDDAVGAVQAPLRELAAETLDRAERLRVLARTDREDLVLDTRVDVDPDRGLRDDRDLAHATRKHRCELMARARSDEDVVRPLLERDPHGQHDGTAASTTSAT